ncbi:hypothetical protein IWW45_001453 [Coemansia sp. RSA 485]|nr:hypothetical protein IWW45_001453 [Coemansia sp. RSA 485]
MVFVLLLVLYYGRVIIRSIGQRSVKKHERTIKELKDRLKSKIDELKKKTAYDTTKSLIDKYSLRDKQDGRVLSPADRAKQQQQMDAKNRRQTMPNFAGSPASQGGMSSPTSPMMPNGMARLPGGLAQQRNAYMGGGPARVNGPVTPQPQMSTGVVKLPGRTASLQPMDSPVKGKGTRPWLDKLVDQLVGDVGGADDRYALICRFCYAHNGLVLEEEINDIQYNCPKCGKFNPSLRTLRLQNRVESQQIIHTPMGGGRGARLYGDYEDFSDYGSSDSDGDGDGNEGGAYEHDSDGSVEGKSIQADMSGEFGTPSPQRTARVGSLGLNDDNNNYNEDAKEKNNDISEGKAASPESGSATQTPTKGKKNSDKGQPIQNTADQCPDPSPEQTLKSPEPAKKTPAKSTSGKRKANKSSKHAE